MIRLVIEQLVLEVYELKRRIITETYQLDLTESSAPVGSQHQTTLTPELGPGQIYNNNSCMYGKMAARSL